MKQQKELANPALTDGACAHSPVNTQFSELQLRQPSLSRDVRAWLTTPPTNCGCMPAPRG